MKCSLSNQKHVEDEEEKENEQYLEVDKIILFVNEHEILNQLNNVNIIKTYGFFQGDEKRMPSILLKYCPINQKKCIELGLYSPSGIAYITIQICHAMKHMHDNSIIHRDIKPENILHSAGKIVKLSDFGISKLVSIDEQISYSNMCGTFHYMAPELLDSNGKYNSSVDVYAFGVVLYFMLTREIPKNFLVIF